MAKPKVVPLPEVRAPSLGDLHIEVEAPPPIDEQQFNEALLEILHDRGQITACPADEPIAAGDEVLVDILAYADGRIVPFSAKERVWMRPDDDALLPGAREALNGHKCGERVSTKVTFPQSYLFEPLAGRALDYAITIKEARRVEPADIEDQALLRSFDAETPEQMFEAVYAGLEQGRVEELENRINFAIFDELQYRLGRVEIPKDILDAELSARWLTLEGTFLQARGVGAEDREHARLAFIRNEGARAELSHGLRVTMALAAVAKEHGLKPDRAQLTASFERYAREANLTLRAVEAEVQGEPDDYAALGSALILECAALFVISKAKVDVVEQLE